MPPLTTRDFDGVVTPADVQLYVVQKLLGGAPFARSLEPLPTGSGRVSWPTAAPTGGGWTARAHPCPPSTSTRAATRLWPKSWPGSSRSRASCATTPASTWPPPWARPSPTAWAASWTTALSAAVATPKTPRLGCGASPPPSRATLCGRASGAPPGSSATPAACPPMSPCARARGRAKPLGSTTWPPLYPDGLVQAGGLTFIQVPSLEADQCLVFDRAQVRLIVAGTSVSRSTPVPASPGHGAGPGDGRFAVAVPVPAKGIRSSPSPRPRSLELPPSRPSQSQGWAGQNPRHRLGNRRPPQSSGGVGLWGANVFLTLLPSATSACAMRPWRSGVTRPECRTPTSTWSWAFVTFAPPLRWAPVRWAPRRRAPPYLRPPSQKGGSTIRPPLGGVATKHPGAEGPPTTRAPTRFVGVEGPQPDRPHRFSPPVARPPRRSPPQGNTPPHVEAPFEGPPLACPLGSSPPPSHQPPSLEHRPGPLLGDVPPPVGAPAPRLEAPPSRHMGAPSRAGPRADRAPS